MCHDVENHNAMQSARIRPSPAKRFPVRLSSFLGGGSALEIFSALLYIGVERLHGNVTARWPGFFVARYLGKILIRKFLPCCLLDRRSLANDQYALTQTIRTRQSSASAKINATPAIQPDRKSLKFMIGRSSKGGLRERQFAILGSCFKARQ
jgi:hypothetical protein